MLQLLADSLWTVPASRFSPYAVLVVAALLIGFVMFDLRAAKAAVPKKKDSMKFMSRYRDENGMPIYFEAGEDPSDRAAHRVLTQKRRANL